MSHSSFVDVIREHLMLDGENVMQYASYTIIVAAIIQFALERPPELTITAFAFTLLLLGLLFTVNVLWQDMHTYFASKDVVDWVFLAASSVLIVSSFAVGQVDFYPYLLFMVIAQAFSTRAPLAAGLFTAVHVALFFGSYYVVYQLPFGQLLGEIGASVLFGIIFVITLSIAVRYTEEQRERVEELLAELQQANEDLRASQQREREFAATTERVRLAREIHDGLGHYLTVLNVQLQAAQKLIQRDAQKAEHVIGVCRQQAQEALQEVRRSVAVMRQTPLDGHSLEEALDVLVSGFDERSPLNADFTHKGTPTELPTAAALTLYRAVQEGLTNAQKHGTGTQAVRVHLVYSGDNVRVQVTNDGEPVSPVSIVQDGSSFGLAGLHERAEQLGGHFHAGPQDDGGFTLQMSIPTQGGVS